MCNMYQWIRRGQLRTRRSLEEHDAELKVLVEGLKQLIDEARGNPAYAGRVCTPRIEFYSDVPRSTQWMPQQQAPLFESESEDTDCTDGPSEAPAHN